MLRSGTSRDSMAATRSRPGPRKGAASRDLGSPRGHAAVSLPAPINVEDNAGAQRPVDPPAGIARVVDQSAIEASVEAERVRMLFGSPAVLLLNPVNASLLAFVLSNVYPVWILMLWVALVGASVAVRLFDRYRFLQAWPIGRGEVARWARRATIGTALTGGLWGLSGSIVLMTRDPACHVFVTFVLGGMMAGSVLQSASYLPAFFAYSSLAIAPQITLYLLQGERASATMGVLLAAYAAVVAATGRRLNRWIRETLRLRIEQTALVGALEGEIGENQRANEQLRRLARFDTLTGLANRDVFVDNVRRAIADAERRGHGFAVLYLDLDHFKDVNDTLGHPIGDQLLAMVAERLRNGVQETDTVARFSCD